VKECKEERKERKMIVNEKDEKECEDLVC